MKIAIDIDNTVFDYSNLFDTAIKLENLDIPSNLKKDEIKEIIKNNQRKFVWPDDWIRIQGRVYGELIKDVHISKSLVEFLNTSKYHIELVSHKTKESLCGRYDLHKVLLNKLEELKIHTEVRLFKSLEEKVQYINDENFDLIVDDLTTVLDALDEDILKIQKNIFTNSYVNLSLWKDIIGFIEFINTYEVISYDLIGKSSYRLKSERKKYFLKAFHHRERIKREVCARDMALIRSKSIYRGELFLIDEYIEHRSIKKFDENFSQQYFNFYTELQKRFSDVSFTATHGILKSYDYFKNIETRLSLLEEDSSEFENLKNELRLKSEAHHIKAFPIVISTPDFYYKNFGRVDDSLIIFDFESFGRDDLARSFLNAIHHVGQKLDESEELNLIELFENLAKTKEEASAFWERVLCFYDIVAFEWILILYKNNRDESQRYLAQMLEHKRKGYRYWSWKQKVVSLIHERL